MKVYMELIKCCIDCPYYSNVNGTMKTARCDHFDGPERILTRREVWGPDVPDECPLEDLP